MSPLPPYQVQSTSSLTSYLLSTYCLLTLGLSLSLSLTVYEDISSHEIKTGTEYDDLGESELMEWLRNGTVLSKSNPTPTPTPPVIYP